MLPMFAWLGGAREVYRMSGLCKRLRCPASKVPNAPLLPAPPAPLFGHIFSDVLDGSAKRCSTAGDKPVQATCRPGDPVLVPRWVSRFCRGAHDSCSTGLESRTASAPVHPGATLTLRISDIVRSQAFTVLATLELP